MHKLYTAERPLLPSLIKPGALLLACLVGIGANINAGAKEFSAVRPAAEQNQSKASAKCTWACQRWTKLCNVDPRGVYKCRRSCAKFGEVCEAEE